MKPERRHHQQQQQPRQRSNNNNNNNNTFKLPVFLAACTCNAQCSMTSVHPSSPEPAFQRFLLSFFTTITHTHTPLPHPSPPFHSVQFRVV